MTKFTRGNIHSAKLSNEEVFEMRRLYCEEGWTQGRLARHFGVAVNTIGRIVRGESRMNVAMPLAPEDHDAIQRRLLDLQAQKDQGILDKLTHEAQRVYDKEVKPEKELDKLVNPTTAAKAADYGAKRNES